MTKRKITYIHLFIWLFAVFANIPYAGINKGMPPQQVVSNIIGFLYLMIVFYLFYLLIAPLFLNRKKLAGFFIISFVVVLIMPFFGYLIIFLSRAYFDGTFENFFKGYSLRTHMSGYFPVLTAAVFGSFFRVIINWFDTMNQKSEIDRQKLAVELNLLKSKLNPHFLFNTLNNIDFLIQNDPEMASAALIKLSEMMRYLTYQTDSEYVELEREIEYLRNYIDLYRMRIKSPDDILFVVKGDLKTLISPALFIPLIENAFKFVRFRNMKPALSISLSSEKGIIVFEISNYYDKDQALNGNTHSGFGISNLKRRLELMYPENHQLNITSNDQQYHVKLTINTNGD
jgi:two-component system, LytTR family, sensor kinase